MLRIDPSASISPLSDLEESVRGTAIVIGAHSVVDSFVKIKPAGGAGDLTIGEHCYINSGCVIYTGNGISIGDNVLLGANVVLAPTNHEYSLQGALIREQGFQPSRGGIYIGGDVWIGSSTVVLDGSRIGDGCVVGAGSVVRGTIPPYSVVVGNPIRHVGQRRPPLQPPEY